VEDYFANVMGQLVGSYHEAYWIGLYIRSGTARPNWVWTDPMTPPPHAADDDVYKHWGLYRVGAQPGARLPWVYGIDRAREMPVAAHSCVHDATRPLPQPGNAPEPNNANPPEDCAVANFTETNQGAWGWADTRCNEQYVYMCKVPGGRRGGGAVRAEAQPVEGQLRGSREPEQLTPLPHPCSRHLVS
jgi:hypothetical protein